MERNRNYQRRPADGPVIPLISTNPDLCIELEELLRRVRSITNDRVLRLPQVAAKTGRAPATIWKDVADLIWPAPFRIGERAVGWLQSEIDAIIEARVFASRSAQPLDMRVFVARLTAPKRGGG
ncbi:MAG: AlpA family transcriptional regulator [Herminiimonas sp.]|nr:AlpA family transcriptional regulator [Herminiimonas sp.]